MPRDPMFLARSMQAQFCADAILALIPAPAKPADGWQLITHAAADVLAERARQISAGGWTPEHDDAHDKGELAGAAACYALYRSQLSAMVVMGENVIETVWPWSLEWWKPSTARRDLVKAGALILAELERLDRAAPPAIDEWGERAQPKLRYAKDKDGLRHLHKLGDVWLLYVNEGDIGNLHRAGIAEEVTAPREGGEG